MDSFFSTYTPREKNTERIVLTQNGGKIFSRVLHSLHPKLIARRTYETFSSNVQQ